MEPTKNHSKVHFKMQIKAFTEKEFTILKQWKTSVVQQNVKDMRNSDWL